MNYAAVHAARALEIIENLLPHVETRQEYVDLVSILKDPDRWKDAHSLFTSIRRNITLPFEMHDAVTLNKCFACVAENAAKTAYNCSGESAPFDDDSFEWLLKSEQRFLHEMKMHG
jgi:hypothetical protein